MAKNAKMPRSLVALSASAVAAVYLAGFGVTQAADTSLGQAAASTPVAVVANGAPTSAPSVATVRGQRSASAQTSTAAPTSSSSSSSTTSPTTSVAGVSATSAPTASGTAASSTAAYKDGTYRGTGNSRRGGISVSVTVQGGRIATVAITGSSTEYPTSRISSLPGQVVSRQSAQVNNVSGATYSAQAFQLAVQQALSKAKA